MKNHLSSLIGQAKSQHDAAVGKLVALRIQRDQIDAAMPEAHRAVEQFQDAHYALIRIAGEHSGE